MAEVLPCSASPALSCSTNDGPPSLLSPADLGSPIGERHRAGRAGHSKRGGRRRGEAFVAVEEAEEEEDKHASGDGELSVVALVLTLLRKSLVGCKTEGGEEMGGMEIGWPTDVRHITHVTFDRFRGFLGLPVEFEPEVPRRAPSASAKVFGVSTESMQCSYDPRGNSVPTILLMMQRCLYEQGGLQAEGIFRINAENSQEEYVRDQLNSGIVPTGIEVHCLAGLIKAWFRELPRGVLDALAPEQVMQCRTEDDCWRVAKLLPVTEAALLDWAVNLMADVVQEEQKNKMNAHNIAMVFAPNMTQMADPLTALMYAVQVMNFLKMLILKTIKVRQDANLDGSSLLGKDPPDGDDDDRKSPPTLPAGCHDDQPEKNFTSQEPLLDSPVDTEERENAPSFSDDVALGSLAEAPADSPASTDAVRAHARRSKAGRSRSQRRTRKSKGQAMTAASDKSSETSVVSRINPKPERTEAWR